MSGFVTPDTRTKIWLIWAVGSTVLITAGAIFDEYISKASVYDTWTDGQRDAYKDGWHACKEGEPPTRGVHYEDEYECDAWYEGYWKALETKRATTLAALGALVSGLITLRITRQQK